MMLRRFFYLTALAAFLLAFLSSSSWAQSDLASQWRTRLFSIHGLSERSVRQLSPADHLALAELATNPAQPLAVRTRAIGLTASVATCERAMNAAERELRIRGGWCFVASAREQGTVAQAAAQLLRRQEPGLREVGVRTLAMIGDADALQHVAQSHSSPTTRRLAAALLKRFPHPTH